MNHADTSVDLASVRSNILLSLAIMNAASSTDPWWNEARRQRLKKIEGELIDQFLKILELDEKGGNE